VLDSTLVQFSRDDLRVKRIVFQQQDMEQVLHLGKSFEPIRALAKAWQRIS
jgi:hypothetical protein